MQDKICTLVGKDFIYSLQFHLLKIYLLALVLLGEDFSVKIYLFWLKLAD